MKNHNWRLFHRLAAADLFDVYFLATNINIYSVSPPYHMAPLPPSPLFVLRRPELTQSAINHLSFFDHRVDGPCLVMSDQSGKVDIWDLEKERRSLFTLDIRKFCSKTEKQIGITWSEILTSQTDTSLFYLASQCRNGSVFFFAIKSDVSLKSLEDLEVSRIFQSNFTAFCKCETFYSSPESYQIFVPVDENGVNFFAVFETIDDCEKNDGLFHSEPKSKLSLPKNYGIPMSCKVMPNGSRSRLLQRRVEKTVSWFY